MGEAGGCGVTPRARAAISGLGAALLIGVCLRLVVTRGGFDWPDEFVYFELRLLRVSAAVTIGAALAIAGVLLQSMLRNPLASPFILGLTSGAGLGIVVATYVGFLLHGAVMAHRPPLSAAVVGAFGALGLVYLLSQRRWLVDPAMLILVGVIISVVCGAVTHLLLHLMPDRGLAMYARWVMGDISEEITWDRVALVGALTAIGLIGSVIMGRSLDAAALGEDEARSVGVRLGWVRAGAFGVAGVLTAGTIVLAGPIGFVGLICPHLARSLGGAQHKGLLIGAALAGAALLVLADVAVTMPELAAGRMPIGVLTALLGGPVFIVLLRRGIGRGVS